MIAVALYGVFSAALWACYLIWLLRISDVPISTFGRYGLRELLIGIVLSVPVTIATISAVADWFWLLLAVATSALMIARAMRNIRSATATL
jgi:hypothetical protein